MTCMTKRRTTCFNKVSSVCHLSACFTLGSLQRLINLLSCDLINLFNTFCNSSSVFQLFLFSLLINTSTHAFKLADLKHSLSHRDTIQNSIHGFLRLN